MHATRTRVVPSMVVGVHVQHCKVLASSTHERLLASTGGGNSQAKDATHSRSNETVEVSLTTRDVVGNNTSLTVCGTCHGERHVHADNAVKLLDSIAHSVDVGHISFHLSVYFDPAKLAQFHTSLDSQGRIRFDTDGKDHNVSREGRALGCVHNEPALGILRKRGHPITQVKLDVMAFKLVRNSCSDFDIDRGYDLICDVNNGHSKSQMAQVFSHFKPHEATTDDDCTLGVRARGDPLLGVLGVRNISDGKDARQVHAGEGWLNRICTRCQNQFVIRDARLFAALDNSNCLGLGINIDDVRVDVHINVETLLKELRGN
eukprot:Colp12_sorted_trinity150504_noHs@13166